jgi:type II secretory pathway component PulF
MPAFRYTAATDTLPEPGAGQVIDAPDRASAVRLLRQRGITPMSVEPADQPVSRGVLRSRRAAGKSDRTGGGSGNVRPTGSSVDRGAAGGIEFTAGPARSERTGESAGELALRVRGRMTTSELAMFIRDIAIATQSGLPLVTSLRTIIKSRSSARQRALIETLTHSVEHGRSLADAAQSIGRPFNELTVNLFRAGEVSGKLSEVLHQSAILLEREIKLRRQLLGGLLYPAFLGVLIALAITIIVGYVVPTIMKPLAGKIDPANMPGPTKLLLAVAAFVKSYWWAMLLIITGGVVVFSQAYRQPASRLAIDRFLLRVPIIGTVLRDVAVARFTRTLGTLLSSGLPALQALKITKGTLGNKAMEQVVDRVVDEVASGRTISDPMERSGAFPPLLTQIISIGERSGRLPQMVLQAASTFEDRVESSLKFLVSVIPPALVLVAALVIALVMAAVLLLLLQLQDMIG